MNKPTTSQKALHEMLRKAGQVAQAERKTKIKKRDNIFSQSRDVREDRDTRQVKTSTTSRNPSPTKTR